MTIIGPTPARPRFGFDVDALEQRIVADRVLLLLRRVAVRDHPQVLAGVQIDRRDAADRSLEERQPRQRIGQAGAAPPRRHVPHRRDRRDRPAARRLVAAAHAAATLDGTGLLRGLGYISIAASTDAPVQPALGATHSAIVVPVWPKQSSLFARDRPHAIHSRCATGCR